MVVESEAAPAETARRITIGIAAALLAVSAGIAILAIFENGASASCPDVQFGPEPPSSAQRRSPLAGISGTGARLRAALGLGPEHVAYCDDFADPFVLRVGNRYYAYSTNTEDLHVPVMRTGELFVTGRRRDALPELPRWARPGATWAPSVLEIDGRYVLYYTTTVAATGAQCISRAIATRPEGPFVDESSSPWICPAHGAAIDASPFVAPDGERYLTWATHNGFAGIVSARLSADGLALVSDAQPLLAAARPWESGVVEGPDLVAAADGFVLFYSGGDWRTAGYAIGAARCDSPLGPCTRLSDAPLLGSMTNAAGPGGSQLFTDTEQRQWLVLHAWVRGEVGYPDGARGLFVARISFPDGRPSLA